MGVVTKEPTLADYAEEWFIEQGYLIPARSSPEWTQLYETWVGYAFSGFKK